MQLVIARNGVTKQSNHIKCLQIMRLLHSVRNDVFFDFSRRESFEKLTSGHCEAHVRRGNLFDNQWLMRLLRFARNDK